MTDLVGYQARESWMGDEYVTLGDVWPTAARAAIVGLNPSPVSVKAGHYYQGRVGQRQLRRIGDVAGWNLPAGVTQFEEAALDAGFGLTDIVKRPTVGERDVSSAELDYGRDVLRAKLEERGVGLVICVFRHPVEALLGEAGMPGLQGARTASGARVFRMPGPFDAADKADAVMQELRELLDESADA
ncbi:uracil-DNA glycosylase family protein [Demequina muriae]|uniref:Uracil-DNA glycosylase family protein n=1 Tax=Demequina muriae TaxID=3051664 RepID=A0ABT8GE84_9MICO|nr:uracil-DNA glycosylase family protein [Demequina sp. EGI L300058]MDN4479729.1 uracil-DNA glycosylase family protein [Demequina sp. EGI L300058]